MCNELAESREVFTVEALHTFLDLLYDICRGHFELEQKFMERQKFPLVEFHAKEHEDLLRENRRIKDFIKSSSLSQPIKKVNAYTSELLNGHIAEDDMVFVKYFKNKEFSLGSGFIGRRCDVLLMSNESIGTGRIIGVKGSDVTISNMGSIIIPVRLNDMVKITSMSESLENQTFIARVYYSTRDVVKLFNATLIQSASDRSFIRVATNLKAEILTPDSIFSGTIVDLSIGGMMLKTSHEISESEDVRVEFEIGGRQMRLRGRVVRTSSKDGVHTYGLRFINLRMGDSDKIHSYVFGLQTASRKRTMDD